VNRPLRLLWLIDSLRVGGAETLALSFVRKHDRARIELYVAYLQAVEGDHLEEDLREAGVKTFLVGAKNLRDWRAFHRLLGFVRGEQIDLIHAHLTYSAIWASLLSRFTRVPSVASLHVAPQEGGRSGLRERILRFALNRWASAAVMVSAALGREYAARGLHEAKLRTVHNGIEGERFRRPREEARDVLGREFGIEADAPVVATVCVLRAPKGVDYLLRAIPSILQRVPNARFLIVGHGEMRESWGRLAEELGVGEAVIWAGHRADVDTFLSGCDLFVLPTLADAFPTVLLEAMAASVPAVASAVGGVPEIVEDGVTGLLVPPRDSSALATAVTRILGDAQLRESMRKAARASAEQKFTTEAWLQRLERLYAEVVR
jgi:glycosyltransferase involved in cell wall biosynthesis